ncbi:hypothetical protein N9R18_00660 [Flavobacteriaceae bacterium]|nr:hypothetical protein [Flavobacteriaceae bacterium]
MGNHVTIGKHCVIHPNVVIYDHCSIGDYVIIHAGTVVGADAFYYKNRAEGHDKLISTGTVKIENSVIAHQTIMGNMTIGHNETI